MDVRLSPELEAVMADTSGSNEPLDLVLELDSVPVDRSLSRADRIDALKARFFDRSKEIRALVERTGGSVRDEAWINSTLKVRVRPETLRELRKADGIRRIELPRAITR